MDIWVGIWAGIWAGMLVSMVIIILSITAPSVIILITTTLNMKILNMIKHRIVISSIMKHEESQHYNIKCNNTQYNDAQHYLPQH